MSSKSPKIAEWLKEFHHPIHPGHYVGYFRFFNRGDYYEAHDILEELWLEGGKHHLDYAFYKGLIQLAGGFVHMKWHFQFPDHRIHGSRLAPAARLLRLAHKNVTPYPTDHHSLDIQSFGQLCVKYIEALESGKFRQNPWDPLDRPQLAPTDLGPV